VNGQDLVVAPGPDRSAVVPDLNNDVAVIAAAVSDVVVVVVVIVKGSMFQLRQDHRKDVLVIPPILVGQKNIHVQKQLIDAVLEIEISVFPNSSSPGLWKSLAHGPEFGLRVTDFEVFVVVVVIVEGPIHRGQDDSVLPLQFFHENPHAERDNAHAAAAITAWFGGRCFGNDKGETGKGRAYVLDTNPVFANAVVSIPGRPAGLV